MKLRRQHVHAIIGPTASGKSTTMRDAAVEYAATGWRVLFVDGEHTEDVLERMHTRADEQGTPRVTLLRLPLGGGADVFRAALPEAQYDVIVVDHPAIFRMGLFDMTVLAKERNCVVITSQQVQTP